MWHQQLNGHAVAFVKIDLLPYKSLKITINFVVRKDGVNHSDFVTTVIKSSYVKYHQNCKTNFPDYKLQS